MLYSYVAVITRVPWLELRLNKLNKLNQHFHNS